MNSLLQTYLSHTQRGDESPSAVSFWAGIDQIKNSSPDIAQSVLAELRDQRSNLKLIASENFSSPAVQAAMGNLLTDKYAEGFPYHRFYAGCDNVDDIESMACKLACDLFGADHAHVQAPSGSDANLIAFWTILREKVQLPELELAAVKSPLDLTADQWALVREKANNQRLLAMDMFAGGHLTHGYRFNLSAQLFDVYSYGVDRNSYRIDYDDLWAKLQEVRPLIFLVGYSAYPRLLDFAKLREMADAVGAVLMVDMAHFAGLVAGKVFTGVNNPIPYASVVTTTTHKTLRGPRGGMVLCQKEYTESLDKACPMVMGGPQPHVIAAKAVALREASTPEFSAYAHEIVKNSRALAEHLQEGGAKVLTGGTDNHLVLADVTGFGLTGRQAEGALRSCGVTLNRNVIPFDENGPWFASGIRVGTPSATTLGMGVDEMKEIADIILLVLKGAQPGTTSEGKPARGKFELAAEIESEAKSRTRALLDTYVLYPEIDMSIAEGAFVD